jgi:hypothetical protein
MDVLVSEIINNKADNITHHAIASPATTISIAHHPP